jgi:hypothetical protein
MKQDRFLTGILIGIAVLVVVALVLFFARKDNETYTDDSTPKGVVQNYIVAVNKHDYDKAYGYLAEKQYKPTSETFHQAYITRMIMPENTAVELGEAQLSGNTAVVPVYLINNPSDPFSSEYRSTDQALLVNQNGEWKITQMPYNFWSYDWYQKPNAPAQP